MSIINAFSNACTSKSSKSQQKRLKFLLLLILPLFSFLIIKNENLPDLFAPQTYLDQFNTQSYNNSDGTSSWFGTSWTEIAEPTGPGPTNGPVQVSPNVTYCLSPNCLRIGGSQPTNPDPGFGVYRELDLSGSNTATLTFSYRRGTFGSPVPTAGTLTLDISANGGSSWTTIQTYNFDGTDASQTAESFDISAYTASNTQIRFLTHGPVDDIVFFIDNIQVEHEYIASTAQFYDEFTTLDYAGSNGTIDWSTSPWYEVGDGAGDIFTGAVAVRNSTRAYGSTGNTLKTSCGHTNSAPGVYIYRELDLSTASTTTLSFYLTHDLSGADDISLEVSNNGGSTWTVLKNYGVSDPEPSNESFDISDYTSPNTQIRFYINSIGGGGSIWTDNVKVEYTAGSGSGPNTITGTVFNDVNNNASFETPDFGEENVTVRLYEDVNENGILDGPDLILESTNTATDGSYSFSIATSGTSGTYSQRVIASADDADSGVDGTLVRTTNGTVTLASKLTGLRFQGLSIPSNATITNAYIQLTAGEGDNGTPSEVVINAEDSPSPPAFVEIDGNISNRTKTTASVNWVIPPWTIDATYNSPDLSSIIQELVNDNGGFSNSSIVLIMDRVANNQRKAYSFDGDPSKAPLLVIEYTEPTTSTEYYITTVDESTLPAGYAWTTDNVETAVFTGGGNTNTGNDFGFYDASLNYISGNVFKDMNTNAVDDTPDEDQSGVTVRVYDDINEDGLVDGGDTLITTTVSDASGAYVFAFNNDYSASGSYSQRVNASADDAHERTVNGHVNITDNSIKLDDRISGVRFQDITIPSNATITNAYVQFTASATDADPSSISIYGEDSANPPAFEANNDDISNRTKTTNFVSWNIPSFSNNNTYDSPDISSVLQELVDDYSGLTNAPVVLILDETGGEIREAHTWDSDPGKAPLLVINWTIPVPDYHYVIETDINTLPPGSTMTTDNVETAYFTAAGQSDADNDFGFEPDHLISGTVYEDLNFSGFFDAGDNGQDNVTVYLYNDVNQDGILDGGDVVVDSIDTQPDGSFYFAPSLNGATQDTSQVNAIADDAEESISSGSIDLTSSDLELVDEGGSNLQIVGMRFTNVAIPQGATITNALVEFEVDETDSGLTNLVFSGEDIDDAPSFSSTAYDISSRTKTTTTVAWNNVAAWTVESEKKQSPSIAGIIQEIVNRPGWVSGNDIVIMVEGSGERTAESTTGEPANAPKLIYSWSEGTLPAYYLLTINENDLPGSGYLVTDNLETAAFTASGQSDSGNDFGFVLNTAPIANDDTESTPEDTPLVSVVLSNDTDVENNIDPSSVIIITPASNGVLNVNTANGEITYTPNPDYNGPDQYYYSVCDSFDLCDTALVAISVTPVNDDPVATDNSFTVSYNTPNQALDVLDAGVADYDVEGNTIQITGAGTDASNGLTTQGGTVVIDDNGTPGDYTDDVVDYTPPNGFTGTDTFLYQISDGLGGTDTATVTLTVLSTTEVDCGNGFDDDGDGMLDCDDPDCTPRTPTGISRY